MKIGIVVLAAAGLMACSDDTGSRRRASVPVSGDAAGLPHDGGSTDGGDPATGGDAFSGDTIATGDSSGGDIGTGDPGPTADCEELERDVCLSTVGCFLDYSENTNASYECRPAQTDCELQKEQSGCEALGTCVWQPGFCYCPADVTCICGGGPAQSCRSACLLGNGDCPAGFYCSAIEHPAGYVEGTLCPTPANESGVCLPVPGGCPDGFTPVCGCEEGTRTPAVFPSECDRRLQRASYVADGACAIF